MPAVFRPRCEVEITNHQIHRSVVAQHGVAEVQQQSLSWPARCGGK